MNGLWQTAGRWLQLWLQHLNGESAYARYCEHLASHHAGTRPLSRDAFHREELDRRWNGVRRCC